MVVLTILKNISQWEGLSHILWILTSKIILKIIKKSIDISHIYISETYYGILWIIQKSLKPPSSDLL
jgi:hypothetical protein